MRIGLVPEPISGYRILRFENSSKTMHLVMLSNGDVYWRSTEHPWSTEPLYYLGNFWGGPPVQTEQQSWGGVKGKYNDGD